MMSKSKTLPKAMLGGSVLAAITASLCCIGPLAATLLGAGGIAASAAFEKWRPLLLGVTVALLALAWYLTYRMPKTDCADGAACAVKPVSKWNKALLWFGTGIVLITAAFPSLSSVILRAGQTGQDACCAPSSTAAANSSALTVNIPSMDCAACAVFIQSKLRKRVGVQSVQVDYATKKALVQYDSLKTSREKIIAAIDETGFKAETAPSCCPISNEPQANEHKQ